jgi:hypothetical protein
VHCATPVKLSPGESDAENAVDAVDGEVIVIPVPPDCHVHANVYPGTPPVAVVVVVPVVKNVGAKPLADSVDGVAVAET